MQNTTALNLVKVRDSHMGNVRLLTVLNQFNIIDAFRALQSC